MEIEGAEGDAHLGNLEVHLSSYELSFRFNVFVLEDLTEFNARSNRFPCFPHQEVLPSSENRQ